MKDDIHDYWLHQASLPEKDAVDALHKVLDPLDRKGVKNSYIDVHLKYHLLSRLRPAKGDALLEIGCGIGRLTEYLSQFAGSVCGIDIADQFIDSCNANPMKHANTHYLKIAHIEKLKDMHINKMYIVWVLMYLTDKAEMIKVLTEYRKNLPDLQSAAVIEQVKTSTQLVTSGGKTVCCYRSIEEYREIFTAAGFRVTGSQVLGERYHGPLYKVIHLACNWLPQGLARFADRFFLIDRYLLGASSSSAGLINDRKPTDVLFTLEAA
jgi:SAM-dependent methyltransferase